MPADVVQRRRLRALVPRRSRSDSRKLLFLTRDELMRHEAAGVTTELFPKTMRLAGIDCALTYHFEPGERARRRHA